MSGFTQRKRNTHLLSPNFVECMVPVDEMGRNRQKYHAHSRQNEKNGGNIEKNGKFRNVVTCRLFEDYLVVDMSMHEANENKNG